MGPEEDATDKTLTDPIKGRIVIEVKQSGRATIEWSKLSIEEAITILIKAPLKLIETDEVVISHISGDKEPHNGKIG